MILSVEDYMCAIVVLSRGYWNSLTSAGVSPFHFVLIYLGQTLSGRVATVASATLHLPQRSLVSSFSM